LGRRREKQIGELIDLPRKGFPGDHKRGIILSLSQGVFDRDEVNVFIRPGLAPSAKPAAIDVVGPLDHLLRIGSANGVVGAEGAFPSQST